MAQILRISTRIVAQGSTRAREVEYGGFSSRFEQQLAVFGGLVVVSAVAGEEEKKQSHQRERECSGGRGSREGEKESLAHNYENTPPFLFFLFQAD